jgi:hypothetical protein
MTATTPELDPDYVPDDGDKRVSMKRSNIDALEAKARRAEAAERENAFYKAGIDPTDTRMGYFLRGYEGEMNAEAIKAAATEAGFLAAPVSDGSAEAAGRVADAASNQSPPPASQADRAKEYAEALASGGSEGLATAVAKYGPVVGRNV